MRHHSEGQWTVDFGLCLCCRRTERGVSTCKYHTCERNPHPDPDRVKNKRTNIMYNYNLEKETFSWNRNFKSVIDTINQFYGIYVNKQLVH
jgi:hypothetical protein